MNAKPITRILDANANRAREGIRSAEDFIRFSIGEIRWSKRLKQIRHSITDTIKKCVSAEALAASRNVATDQGRPDGSTEFYENAPGVAPKEVALRGFKRAQEALRVLEEYVRSEFSDASSAFSRMRFELYEAEQWLVLSSESVGILRHARLYVLISEAQASKGLEATARAALKGGATVLQMREKEKDGAALLDEARRLLDLSKEFGALFVVNDRVDVALAAGAPCIHLGQKDLPTAAVRKLAGEGLLIGRSTHSVEQARLAVEEDGADYIAVGSMYETATKAGYELNGPPLAKAVLERKWDVPVFAIGGINAARAKELRAVGVKGIAVSSAVVTAPDPERAARELIEALEG